MKRMHIHIGVEDLERSIRFYSALFGAEPVKTRPDYAKWLLDDPAVNFAVSTRAAVKGVDHLGLQAEEETELESFRERLGRAGTTVFDEGETVCCYARSDKSWVRDPGDMAWEVYRTMDEAQVFSVDDDNASQACCTPETRRQADCCVPVDGKGACCDQ
jgi:catechol 2,3-dioxygenase-like lactoylglutathione lyase family enzyme